MKRILAVLTLMAVVAIVANMPGPTPYSDRPRHEKVSLAAIAALPTFTAVAALDVREIEQAIAAAHGRYVSGLAAQAAPAAIAPDPTLTPGAVRTIDLGEICSRGTRQLRHWDRTRDDRVMAEYGLPAGPHPDFEIDHLIPLGIGGADSDANLWPEPRRSIEPQWNVETKDRLEWKLRDLVCSGQLDVVAAQRAIADDWVEAYGRFFHEPRAMQHDSVPPSRQPGDTPE
jgi:hypothetical protein